MSVFFWEINLSGINAIDDDDVCIIHSKKKNKILSICLNKFLKISLKLKFEIYANELQCCPDVQYCNHDDNIILHEYILSTFSFLFCSSHLKMRIQTSLKKLSFILSFHCDPKKYCWTTTKTNVIHLFYYHSISDQDFLLPFVFFLNLFIFINIFLQTMNDHAYH